MFRTPSLSSNARSAHQLRNGLMVRKSSDMRGVNDASRAHSKWASRASFDPFNSAQSNASDAQNCHETTALLSDQDSDGKENRVPPIGRNWGHPNVTMRRGSRYSLLEAELLPSTPNFERSTASSLLGKRPATNKSLNASTETKEDDSDAERAQRNPLAAANAVTHFEARALALHAESLGLEEENIGTGSATMLVDDFTTLDSSFRRCVTGRAQKQTVDTRERQRARQCQSQVRRIRMNRSGEESAHKKTRFKCDLHVCVVDALKSVTLRVTFDPLPTDVGKEVTAMLKFTVNDRFKLQCRATGRDAAVPRESRLSRFGKAKAPVDTVVVAQQRRPPRIPEASARHASGRFSLKEIFRWIVVETTSEVYDDNWMAKQTQGFTKWINYVLLDGTAQRLGGHDAQDNDEGQTVGVKRRFDFSSLRVLAQKRMESKWAQAAVDLYHSPSMDDILFNLQDEIGNKGLLFRADRPVYADVGLQEDLISLLNNYHPEKCSLRAIFRTTARVPSSGKKDDALTDRKMPQVLRRIILKHLVKDSHVAQNYRLVKNLMTPMDGSTADRNDGGNAFTNTKKNINGREYFDSLTQSFMLKFFMLVIFLDRAVERKADKFAHFPCLFRIAPSTKKTTSSNAQSVNKSSNNDELWVKNSQVFVTEFCRFFLASEGRIDKHLKHLGYTLKHEQTPLDEIDLEVKNLETDLRDGVRLAKLMEALTTAPVPATTEQDGEIIPQSKGLSTFLRVPALSRLQKVHNVEICLHFLRDKCGASVLDNLKSSNSRGDKKSGRVRVSSCGFAGLRSKVDEKMVGNLAKDIVNGHREKTLALLWKLISCFQLQSLVDAQTMRREIDNVAKRMSFSAKDFFDNQQQSEPLIHTDEHECYTLLLEWCRAVCSNYNVAVRDFSGSFADGKALCYLLHYYHPMLLAKSDMLPTTSDVNEGEVQQMSEKTLLNNEQRHFAIINDRIKQLGEVPVLMPQQYNTKNPPEDKMVVTFVCYLQSRLMDSYSEIHAASRLKRWWKSPLIRLKMHRKKSRSARVVQRFWYTSSHKRLAIRQCRKLLRAAHLVKSTRAFRTHRQLRSNGDSLGAVLVVQYHWRKQLRWRREKERQKQKAMRHKVAQRVRVRASCAVIERNWLQYLSREGAPFELMMKEKEIQKRQLKLKNKCVQKCFRKFTLRKREVAATKLASAFRGKKQKLKFQKEKHAALVLQRNVRVWRRRRQLSALTQFHDMLKSYQRMKATESQRRVMRLQELKHMVETRAAYSSASLDSEELTQLRGLLSFQKMLLRYRRMQREEEEQQEHIRQHRLRRLQESVEHRAANRIQSVYRVYAYHKRMLAATRIQAAFRGFMKRQQYAKTYASVVLIQRAVRSWLVVTRFRRALRLHRAAVSIQKLARGWSSRRLRLNFYTLQTQLQRLRVLMSCWQIEFWYAKHTMTQRMQVWWLGLCCKWAERQRRAEEKRQREMETMALAMAKARAERIVGSWLRAKAWWRGTLVRLHHSTPEITQQRKKLSTMKLVGQQTYASSATSATSLQPLRVKAHEDRRVQTEQPQTLAHDWTWLYTCSYMVSDYKTCCLQATRLRCARAIRVNAAATAPCGATASATASLEELTVYRRSADKSRTDSTWICALWTRSWPAHIHRDMHHVFVLSADVITYYLELLKPLVDRNAGVQESWSEAEKRLSV
ncbi:Abnormal spindle-like microcephaly-associated protein, ASH domain [Phytophthora cactorum]|nr:Abnormal spindle-like microcephaly-associated protein, ASH domain [Phytophthora cactorum]